MHAAIIPTTTQEAFIDAAVTVLEKAIRLAIETNGRCILGLSGGTTPAPVYEALGMVTSIDWERVHVFLVDERCVPITDDRSNARLVQTTLLADAPVPDLQRHFPDTSLSPSEAARTYDRTLRSLLADSGPDIVVLGMGDDGHVASLFPPIGTADLHAAEYAVDTEVPPGPDGAPKFPVKDRISTTLTLLRTAETKVFLLSGEKKKAAWAETSKPGADPLRWPGSLLLHHAITVTRW